ASRRFRAVMMTAVSFIIGVLPLKLRTGAGAHIRPIIPPTVLSGLVVATGVGILLKTAPIVLLQPHTDCSQRINQSFPKTHK
ncbi:efflux RND transporter permease subunit, partial [Enterobacter hormaechei]